MPPSPPPAPPGPRTPLLAIKDLHVSYGMIEALHGVNIAVDQGEVVTLIGSNGAGKTTLLRTISGLLKPASGSILLDETTDLTKLPAYEIVRKGVSHSPEGRQVFAQLTIRENLILGAYQRHDADIGADMDKCFALFPVLKERQSQKSGTLSGGEQQMLAMGRALMARPRLLLLDEPSLGLAPLVVKKIFEIIREIAAAGTTIFLVEQNANMALGVAKRGYVLETGRVALADTAAALLASPAVREAYLGG